MGTVCLPLFSSWLLNYLAWAAGSPVFVFVCILCVCKLLCQIQIPDPDFPTKKSPNKSG